MKIGLVNTNRYLEPPVIPVGLEYLIRPLADAGHEASICDLAFSDSPEKDLVAFIDESRPQALGFAVRNVDTAVFEHSVFFLDEVAELVRTVREHAGVPVIVGGTATLSSREPLRAYLGADHLVAGPGERALPALLSALDAGDNPGQVIDGWAWGTDPRIVHGRGTMLAYGHYLEGGNPAGIEFRKGCDGVCGFCIERCRPVRAREIECVVAEALDLADAGVEMLFLCDSEVNIDLDDTVSFLESFAAAGAGLSWTGYFRPSPVSRRMAKAASSSGCSSVTLSVVSSELSAGYGPFARNKVRDFIELFAGEGIDIAVDLLVGSPGESRESIENAFEFLARTRPRTVGVMSHVRLYGGMPVCEDALDAVSGGEGSLLGEIRGNDEMLKPVFFNRLDRDRLEELTGGDPLFVLEGDTGTVNYQRVRE